MNLLFYPLKILSSGRGKVNQRYKRKAEKESMTFSVEK